MIDLGQDYAAENDGENINFYAKSRLIFIVPAAAAGSEASKRHFVRIWEEGQRDGNLSGYRRMQEDFRGLINAAPLEPC